MKHTKGSWTFDKDEFGTWIQSDLFPEPIAKMGSSSNLPTEANARLIAAAPELLEALQNVLWNFEGKEKELTPVQKACIKYVKQAIQKATE